MTSSLRTLKLRPGRGWTPLLLLPVLLLAVSPPLAASPGDLTPIQVLTDGVGGIDGLAANRWVEVSPDGRNLYAAGQGDDSLAVFARDRASGRLEEIQVVTQGVDGADGLGGVSSVAVSPDGRSLYTTATFEGAVGVFDRDPATGRLAFRQVLREGIEVPVGLRFAVWVRVSPDGRNVYATGFFDDAVVGFRRDPADGTLAPIQVLRDGVDGIEHFDGVFPLVLDRGGRNVYVGAFLDNAVTVLERDPVTGLLAPVQVLEDDAGGVDGLLRVRGLAVSGDGRTLWTCSAGDDALVAFDRDPVSGRLAPRQALFDPADGVDGITGANAVAESPDGSTLWTAAFQEAALGVFRVDPSGRRMDFVRAVRLADDSLDGPISLSPSPDGRFLYAGSFFSGRLVVFRVD